MMIPIYLTYILAFGFYFLSVLIHMLVLNKRIDYKLVNGGRSKYFDDQKKQSQSSIIVLMALFIYILITALIPSFRETLGYLIITSIITLFWLLGTIMQLLGTKFEKRVVLWINIIGLLSHIILIIEYV